MTFLKDLIYSTSLKKKNKITKNIILFGILTIIFIPATFVRIDTVLATTTNIQQQGEYKVAFSTYLGGSLNDYVKAVTEDANGNIYATGYTYSADFPVKNAWNSTFGGGTDVFVSKFSPSGYLLFSTFLGGSSVDFGYGIKVDSEGNVYVYGETQSNDFTTKNAYQPGFKGASDVFLAKFDPTGNLLFSTLLGGYQYDHATGLALDNLGNIYITGYTFSPTFPTRNPLPIAYMGTSMAFLAKFDAQGALLYSTFLGGSATDIGYAVATDANNNCYIAGQTNSNDFPIVNGYQTTRNGSYDGFITEFNTTGQIIYSSYFGGNQSEEITSIAVNSNTVTVTGFTSSFNLPLVNAFDGVFAGGFSDVFVARFTNNNQLSFSSFLGGSVDDYSYGIAVDTSGNSYVTGFTDSTNFPVKIPFQNSNAGVNDMFVTKIASNGSLDFSSYLGGLNDDYGRAIIVDSNSNILVAGESGSNGLGSVNGYYINNSGNFDGFIIKYSDVNAPQQTESSSFTTAQSLATATATVTVTSPGGLDQQLLSNPVFTGGIGIIVILTFFNTILLFFRKK